MKLLCKEAGNQYIRSTTRTHDCGVATFMVVGDKQDKRIHKDISFFLRLIKANSF